MSEPAGGDSPGLGGIPAAAPSPTAVNIESGKKNATASDSASPILQHPNQDIADEVPAPAETTAPINNSTDDTIGNKEAAAEEAVGASAQTFKVLQPHDASEPLPAAATAATATNNDNISPAANNTATNSSSAAAAPIIAKPALDIHTNSDAATAANSSSRNPSPINILEDIASVEELSGEDQDNREVDNIQKDNVTGTIAAETLLSSDIILSLKENTYKTIMYQYFRKLEENANSGLKDDEEEIKARDEVFELLKNSGERLLDPVSSDEPGLGFVELDEETARKRIGYHISKRNESKGEWHVMNAGVPSHKKLVPRNIFLSLKNDFYRENMFTFFRKLGAVNESQRDSEKEKRVKDKAYDFFRTSGGKLVQHNNWKKPEQGYYECDEEYARKKISDDIRRRLESRDRWENAAAGTEDDSSNADETPASNNYDIRVNVNNLAPVVRGEDVEQLPIRTSMRIAQSQSFNGERDEIEADTSYSNLDKYTLEYLKSWMTMTLHVEDPYPSEADKARIIRDTGISEDNLYNWFVANRTRKWKPALKNIKTKYGITQHAALAPHMKEELSQSIFSANEHADFLNGIFSKEGIATDKGIEMKRKLAALPEPWEEYFDENTNYYYYYNRETGAVQWKHPAFGSDERKAPQDPTQAVASRQIAAKLSPAKQRPTKLKPPKELFSAADLEKTAKFNVGGNLFEVLCSCLPNSQESRIAQTAQASIRGNVAIPIARDVEIFSICVRFLRKGKADLPGNIPQQLFLEELDYFGIPYDVDLRNTVRRKQTVYAAPRGRKKMCGSCPNCLRDDCGECANCLDMLKFGGRGVKRQRCVERRCLVVDSPTAATAAASKPRKDAGKTKGPAKLISSKAKKAETSWEDEFAKIQAELNRKAKEAGKAGKTFGLTSAVTKKSSRSSARNSDKKRRRKTAETSSDDDTTNSSQLHSEAESWYGSTGRKTMRNAAGHIKVPAYGPTETFKATGNVQKRYDDAQKKKRDEIKPQSVQEVRGVTMRPSGKWQVQYYYCGSSRYIGVFQSKEDALNAYEVTRSILGREENEALSKDQILHNINLARNAAFSDRGLTYKGPQPMHTSIIRSTEHREAPRQTTRVSARQKKNHDTDSDSINGVNRGGKAETITRDGRYSLNRCSAMGCDEVAVFGDRCIAHRPLCSTRGCQKRVHSDGKCKTHMTSSKRRTSQSRGVIPFDVGYKFRKQFDGDLFEGEVMELLTGGGNDRRCKYLIDGFVEDLSIADLKLLAQTEVENPVELGKVGYRFRKQFHDGWYDGIVVKVLKRGANGKDRRVHYAEDDDFEDVSLDELRMLVSLDHQACDECRTRMLFCDGTQHYCLNKKTDILEVEPEEVVEEAAQVMLYERDEGDEKNRSRHSRRRSGVHKETSSNTNGERVGSQVQTFQPSENDVILSLRDSRYKKLMFETYRKLGAKRDSERDRAVEKEAKVEVFNSLKNSGFRLVKLVNHRKPDLGCIEVDETYARDKIFNDICRRLESAKQWANDESDNESSKDLEPEPPQNLKHRPRVRAKGTAAVDVAAAEEPESEPGLVIQDESKRRKLKEKCPVHGSTCQIYAALDVGPGWTVHIVPRKSGNHSPDKFFFAPTGEKFRSFISVKRFVEQGGNEQEKKRKRADSIAESVDSSFHNDICECCGGLGELLCCSTCNLVYHIECARPRLSALPEGDWSCAFCVAAGTGVKNTEPPLTKTAAIQGVKDIEALKKQSFQMSKRPRTA